MSRGIYEELVQVFPGAQVSALRSEIPNHRAPFAGDLLLNVQVVRLDVGVVEVGIHDRWREAASGGSRDQVCIGGGRSCTAVKGFRAAQRWVSGQAGNQICNRLISKKTIASTKHRLAPAKDVEGKTDARLEVGIVLFIR